MDSCTEKKTGSAPPRVLGFMDVLLLYVVTGISLRWIATAATAGPSGITVWIGAWLCLYIPLVLAVMELSSRYPEEGGLYIWTKRTFGDFAAVIAGWTYWTSNLPYFPAVLYFAASNVLYVRQQHWKELSNSALYYIGFSLFALAVITAMNVVGLDVAKWLHNLGAIGMWLPALIIITLGPTMWHRFGSATNFTARSFVPAIHIKDMIFWASLTFALGGAETASFMAAEVKNAERVIPRALLSAGTLIILSYILGTFSVLMAVPSPMVNDLEGLMQGIASASIKTGWTILIPISAVLIAFSNLGAAGAYLAATARLPFVAGIDQFLPSAFARLHPRWRTPYVALLTQTSFAALFVFLAQAGTTVKGAYDVLVSMGIITYFIPYLFVFAAVFRIHWQAVGNRTLYYHATRTAKLFVYAVGLTTTLLTIILSLTPSPEEQNKVLATGKVCGVTAAVLALGTFLFRRSSVKDRIRTAVFESE